jgi:hypothetical protein
VTKRLNSRQGIPRIPTIPRWRLRRRRNGLPPRPTGRLALPSLAFRIRPIRRSPASNRATVRQDMDSRGTHNPSCRRNSNRHSSSPRKNASAPTSRASLRIAGREKAGDGRAESKHQGKGRRVGCQAANRTGRSCVRFRRVEKLLNDSPLIRLYYLYVPRPNLRNPSFCHSLQRVSAEHSGTSPDVAGLLDRCRVSALR